MADQVVLMRGGRIEQDAPPATLYEKPATIFAARFVGTPPMNVIPAALVPDNLATPPSGRARDTLAIGIRPEAVRLSAEGLSATVAAVEYLGADTLLDTRLAHVPEKWSPVFRDGHAPTQESTDQSFIVRVGGRANASTGDTVHISWDAEAAHWFDLSSQCRIDR
jgi:sn-glycerol 3-phosphate transport system ATP-binding protein